MKNQNNSTNNQNTFKDWLWQLAVALTYLFSGVLIHHVFKSSVVASAIWPGSGIALAALLLGGKRYIWGVFLGALLLNVLSQNSLWVAGGITSANTLEALAGLRLLTRNGRPLVELRSLADFMRLLAWGGGAASLVGAVIGTSTLIFAGFVTTNYVDNAFHWWMGDTLGVALFTSLILVWWQSRALTYSGIQLLENLLLLGTTFVAGQIVFLGWFHEYLSDTPRGYVMFLFVAILAIRVGGRSTALALVIIAFQALLGAYQGVGFFAYDIARAGLYNYGAYMLIISIVGMAITTHADEIKRVNDNFASTLQAIPDLLFELGQNGEYLNIWAHNQELLAAQNEILLGHTVNEILPTEAANTVMSALKEAGDNGYSRGQVILLKLPQGDSWFELSTSLKASSDASDRRFIMLSRDITERIKAQESLRKLSVAIEQSAASVVITDEEARIQYVNPYFIKNTGYSAAEAIGQNPRILQSGQTPNEIYQELWSKLTSGQSWTGELLNKRKNGELYWEDVSIAPVRNTEGVITHYVALKTEITVRKKMEAALAESEYRYRTLVENSPFCIHEIDLEGRLQSMNHAGLDMLGLNDEKQICGIAYLSAVSEQDSGRIKALLQDAINGTTSHFEFFASGDVPLHFKSCFIPIKDAGGKVIKLMGMTEDITERKRIEQQLVEREELFCAIFEQAPNGVELIDPNTLRFIEANPAACRMLGYTHEEYLQLRLDDTQASLRGEALIAAVRHVEESGGATFENQHRCKNGDLLEVEITTRMLNVLGKRLLVGVWRDITESKRAKLQLMESELQYRTLADSGQALIWTSGTDKLCDYFNKVWLDFTGRSMEQEVGNGWAECVHPDDLQQCLDEYISSFDRREKFGMDYRLRRHDGEYRWIRDEGCPRYNGAGEFIGYIGYCLDIAERKQIEEAHRRVSMALAQSDEAIALTDTQARYIYANPAFSKLFGYELDELLGNSIDLLMPPEEVSGATSRQTIAAAREQGAFHNEVWRRAKNGTIIPILLKVSQFRNERGELMGYIASMTDLTEIKRMEDTLRESEKHFREVIELAPLGTVTVTLDGRFIEVNQAFCDIVGYSKEALKNLSFEAITHPDDINISTENIKQLMAGQIDSYQIEKRYFHRDGHVIWARVNTSLQRSLSGEPQCLIAQMEDITAQRQAEEALRESEAKLRSLYELSPLGIALTDMNGRYLEFNESFRRICDYPDEELRALDYWALTPRKYEADEARQLELLSSIGRYGPYEKEYMRKDGSLIPLSLNGVLITGRAGKNYIWSIVENITERKQAEENLRITASVFGNSQEAILITDTNNTIIDVNPAFTHITGYSRDEVLGRNPKLLSSGRQDKAFYTGMWQSLNQKRAWRGEIWNQRKSGEIYAEQLSISAICDNDGKVLRYVAVFSDISHLKEHEAELSRVAHYDALTGIPNRVLLADRMKQAIAQTAREQNMMAVCYLDLDGFKPVNDTLGHEAGDQVLVEIAKRLGNTIRGGDTVARLGGDEFVLLLLGQERGEECVFTLERLLAVIAKPIILNGKTVSLGASIGVSIYPLDEEDPDTLLRHADQAMYVAKQSGKNRFCIFDLDLDKRARDQHEFLKGVRHSLEHNQFVFYYQPKVNLRTKEMVGVEALIRWRHPKRGLLPPAEFLRHVEKTELDIAIGEWVIASALAQMNRWHQAELDIEVSVNISAYHLESSGFVEKLHQQLAYYPELRPGKFQIEVLETAALNDMDIVSKIITSCRKIGIKFALDDFGTGYSSLSYLSNLPVDVLKIDQSFVRDMLEDKGDMAIVQGIIALARAFDRQTVAEGIETAEQYQMLLDMGCELGQGYYIARPMLAEELANWKVKHLT